MKIQIIILAIALLSAMAGCRGEREFKNPHGIDNDGDGRSKAYDCDDSNPDSLICDDGAPCLGSQQCASGELISLDGFASLTSLTTLTIQYNDALSSMNGLSNLTTMSLGLTIRSNASLVNLNGLSSLSSVGANLSISSNPVLTQLDLGSLISIEVDGLSIYDNPLLDQLDLSNLISVEGRFNIVNTALTHLDDLSSLTSVGGILEIRENDALTQLDGLSSLTSVGDLDIYDNAVLTELDGLSNLTSVEDSLNINNNPSLCQSIVDTFLTAFGEVCTACGETGNISDNDDGC